MLENQSVESVNQVVKDIDKLINEMLQVRRKVASLNIEKKTIKKSIREAEWFGIWADREDMNNLSSSEWLRKLREKQWAR